MRVYHLTSGHHGLSNIRHRRLKIAQIDDLNDPFELRGYASTEHDVRAAVELTRKQLAAQNGMLCFSARWHNPVLWAHYADKHRGVALGFEVPDECLIKVAYQQKRLPLDLTSIYGTPSAAQRQMLAMLATKYSHWRYESEWRAFLTLEEKDDATGLYFSPFSDQLRLREVIVGTLSTISRGELSDALGSLGRDVKALKARLAFQSFRVVRQQKSSMWT